MTRRRLLAGLLLLGCRRKRQSVEEQIRALIDRVEKAVEEKDLDPVKEVLSEQYKDGHGGDRATVIRTLQVMFLRHPSIHLLVRVRAVDLIAPQKARATLVVGMASVPVQSPDELPRVNADLYQFVLTFAEEAPERHRLVEASWDQAGLDAFL